MKKFRLLAAMVITVVMLFTVAFAADVVIDAPAYNGTDDTYTVTVTAAKDLNLAQYASLNLLYNENVFSYTAGNATSSDTRAGFSTPASGYAVIYSADGGVTTISKDSVILKVVFNVLDKANVVGSTFSIDESNSMFWDEFFTYYDGAASATVAAAAQDVKVPNTAAQVSAAGAEVKIGNLFYEGVVVFNNKIVLEAERNAKAVGWTLTAEGKSARDIEYTLPEIKSDGGEVQFAGVVFNVPENVTITATPYVVYGN